jgi:hypothetical protein
MSTDSTQPQGTADQTASGDLQTENDNTDVVSLLVIPTDSDRLNHKKAKIYRRPGHRRIQKERHWKRWFRNQLMSYNRDMLLETPIEAEKVIREARAAFAKMTFSPANDQ